MVRAEGNGSKAQCDRLRQTMLAQGYAIEQIAIDMMQRWGFRRRKAWRCAHGWSQRQLADRYNQLVDDPRAPMTSKRISDYENWPDSNAKPTTKTLTILARIYGTVPWKLVDHYDLDAMNSDERTALRPPQQSALAVIGSTSEALEPTYKNQPSDLFMQSSRTAVMAVPSSSPRLVAWQAQYTGAWGSDSAWKAAFMASANESSEHAARAEGTNVGPMTLDELRDDVVRLARVSGKLDVMPFFPEMVRARDRIYRLLDGHQYPRQTTDLYFLAGVICGVLADASDCLGYGSAAMEHTRAALTYADIIGHNSLRVWCRTMQAWLAQSDDRPQHAVAFAQSGREFATSDACRVWLYSAEGQALALMGDNERASEAFNTAGLSVDSEIEPDDLFDDIGGTFQYSPARMHRSMALGYIQAGNTAQAVDAARKGIEIFVTERSERRDYGNEASLHIELATAHILDGQLDSAQSAIQSVFTLPLNQRVSWLGADVKRFRRALAQLPDKRSAEFQALQSGTEEFASTLLSQSMGGTALT